MTADAAEFGDVWDLMSQEGRWWPDPTFNPAPQHMIAHNKDLLGCIPATREFAAVGGTQTITLERLAQPGPGGYLLAQIPIAGSATRFYTVEARRQIGFDASLPADAVVIHEVDTTRPMPALLVSREKERDLRGSGSIWKAGQRFFDGEHGIAVMVDGETASGFVVTITID